MAIRKREFYEGAALHQLIRAGAESIRHEPPFFIVDGRLSIYLKYSTKGRSPWGFTFASEEQAILEERAARGPLAIGLVCGSDGIAAVGHHRFCRIAKRKDCSVHLACYRKYGEHYSLSGPDGSLARKISPSHWQRFLSIGAHREAL